MNWKPPYLTISWIGLTSVIPLSALLIAWTIISIHRQRNKSILLLGIIYAQLLLQIVNFAVSTFTLLRMDPLYLSYFSYAFNCLMLFKSLSVLSIHLEEFYKVKSPSNYLLNINSSLLKYHLLVILLLSLMATYLTRGIEFLPTFGIDDGLIVATYVTFQSIIIILSLFLISIKALIGKSKIDLNVIIGTNSTTTSSTNLFNGLRDWSCSTVHNNTSNNTIGLATSSVAATNLLLNSTLLICVFWMYWLPIPWPIPNIILWIQLLESFLTPLVYFIICRIGKKDHRNKHERSSSHDLHSSHKSSSIVSPRTYNQSSSSQSVAITNGSFCFNNGEFTYFPGSSANGIIGGKYRRNRSNTGGGFESTLNNGTLESDYNTLDSFQQVRSYNTDSFRCASVTTVANDDFEFLSRERGTIPPSSSPYQNQDLFITNQNEYSTSTANQNQQNHQSKIIIPDLKKTKQGKIIRNDISTSLSMNDLDLLDEDEDCIREPSPSASSSSKLTSSLNSNGNNLKGICQNDNSKSKYTVGDVNIESAVISSEHSSKYKYKKNSHQIKKRFLNKGMNRRVLSLESLHSPVNETHLAYLDTGERVIVFTTDFI